MKKISFFIGVISIGFLLGEAPQIGFNVFVAALAAFIAWGRNRA